MITSIVVDHLCSRFGNNGSIGIAYLHYNFRHGREAVAELLLMQGGVDPNSKSDSGQAPLSLAAENGQDTSQTQSLDEFYISSGISVTREVVRLC